MDAVNYSSLRQNLKKYLDSVFNDHEPLIVTRKNDENVVILSVDDFNALNETQYLLSTKNNAEHLQNSLSQLRSGKGLIKELIEEWKIFFFLMNPGMIIFIGKKQIKKILKELMHLSKRLKEIPLMVLVNQSPLSIN